jgi:hypothetical protein
MSWQLSAFIIVIVDDFTVQGHLKDAAMPLFQNRFYAKGIGY